MLYVATHSKSFCVYWRKMKSRFQSEIVEGRLPSAFGSKVGMELEEGIRVVSFPRDHVKKACVHPTYTLKVKLSKDSCSAYQKKFTPLNH